MDRARRSVMQPSIAGGKDTFDHLHIRDVESMLYTTFATDLDVQGLQVCRGLLRGVKKKFWNFQFERDHREKYAETLIHDKKILKPKPLHQEGSEGCGVM